jgi:uncharacterized damage-inducible protein DinB
MTAQTPRTLAPFYQGWGDYQALLSDALAPLTAEQLALQATPGQRPLWLLAAHIIGTRIGWFRRMGEADDPALAPLDLWDEDGAPPRTAAELVSGLEQTWAMVAACLDRWTPADLDTPFTWERAGSPRTRTRQWIIWHVLEHDLHHGGEISLTLGNHGLTALDL